MGKRVARIFRALTPPPSERAQVCGRAPGHFPSHPPRSRSCKLKKRVLGTSINRVLPPPVYTSLPLPPLEKYRERKRKKKVTNLRTSLRKGFASDLERPHARDLARRHRAGGRVAACLWVLAARPPRFGSPHRSASLWPRTQPGPRAVALRSGPKLRK